MSFLKNYEFTENDIEDLKNNTTDKLLNAIIQNKVLIGKNIEYLMELGIENYKTIFIKYYDNFFMDNSNFINMLSKYDRQDLIDKLKRNPAIFVFL